MNRELAAEILTEYYKQAVALAKQNNLCNLGIAIGRLKKHNTAGCTLKGIDIQPEANEDAEDEPFYLLRCSNRDKR